MALQQNFVSDDNSVIDESFKIFPNPSKGEINVMIKNIKDQEIIINIYNNFGQLIYNDKSNNQHSMISKKISLRDISKGVYYFEAIGNNIHKKRTFIID